MNPSEEKTTGNRAVIVTLLLIVAFYVSFILLVKYRTPPDTHPDPEYAQDNQASNYPW